MDNNTKLLAAGYTIIRKDERRLVIKQFTRAKSSECVLGHSLSWQDIRKGFKSKAELKREYNKLLELAMVIEG